MNKTPGSSCNYSRMRSGVKTSSPEENSQSKCSVWILSKIQGTDNSSLLQNIAENKIIGKDIQLIAWA